MDHEMASLLLDTYADRAAADADQNSVWAFAASIARTCQFAHAAATAWQAAQTRAILDGRNVEGNVCTEAFVALARNCTRCETLELHGINYESLSGGLASLAFPLLRKLVVTSVPASAAHAAAGAGLRADESLHDGVMGGLLEMMKLCPHVRELRLDDLTDRPSPLRYTYADAYRFHANRSRVSVIGRIARVCPLLETLDVERSCLNGHDIRAIADGCPNFESLQAWSADLHDGTLLELSRLRSLRVLTLGLEVSWHGRLRSVAWETSSTDAMGDQIPCTVGMNDQFDRFARGTPLLSHLSLSSEDRIVNDTNLCSLARSCPELALLEAPECCEITDAGVAALVRGCPRLTSLNIGSNSYPTSSHSGADITDVSVYSIARGLPALTELNLRGCGEVTEAAIADLKAALPNVVVELPWSEIDHWENE